MGICDSREQVNVMPRSPRYDFASVEAANHSQTCKVGESEVNTQFGGTYIPDNPMHPVVEAVSGTDIRRGSGTTLKQPEQLQEAKSQSGGIIEDLLEKREQVNEQILKEERELQAVQKDLSILTEKLRRLNETMAQQTAARNDYDKTIQEKTEAAHVKSWNNSYLQRNITQYGPSIYAVVNHVCKKRTAILDLFPGMSHLVVDTIIEFVVAPFEVAHHPGNEKVSLFGSMAWNCTHVAIPKECGIRRSQLHYVKEFKNIEVISSWKDGECKCRTVKEFIYDYGFNPADSAELLEAVDLWCQVGGTAHAMESYGHIKIWNVSQVTSMKNLFWKKDRFNEDLSGWDVSSVWSMSGMFFGASAFNQDLSSWDVSSVEVMTGMFCGASAFNQDLSSWDVSSVRKMHAMFQNASAFKQDLTSWDVSSVTEQKDTSFYITWRNEKKDRLSGRYTTWRQRQKERLRQKERSSRR